MSAIKMTMPWNCGFTLDGPSYLPLNYFPTGCILSSNCRLISSLLLFLLVFWIKFENSKWRKSVWRKNEKYSRNQHHEDVIPNRLREIDRERDRAKWRWREIVGTSDTVSHFSLLRFNKHIMNTHFIFLSSFYYLGNPTRGDSYIFYAWLSHPFVTSTLSALSLRFYSKFLSSR